MMAEVDDVSVSVVLPAGGSGERFGSSTPKQFCHVLDRPIILYTLHTFHNISADHGPLSGRPAKCRLSWVRHIVVTVPPPYLDYMEELVETHGYSKVRVARGGSTRHRSIYNGIKALKAVLEPSDVVLIHDAVRAFVDESIIKDIAMAAKETGAAGIHRPLISTVIASDECGFLEESLDRNRYRASEMPQGFIFSIILSAYEKATDYDLDYGTECLHLAMKYSGTKARLVEGPHNLWKVTLRKDMYAAEGTLKENEVQVQLVGCGDRELIKCLQQTLGDRQLKTTVCDSVEMCDLVDINSTVYYHTQLDCDVISEYTDNHVKDHRKDSLRPFLDKVIVHVIRTDDELVDSCGKLYDSVQKKCKSWRKKHLLVYLVLCETNSSPSAVSEIVASVVWTREPVMVGQTYVALS